MGKQEVLGEEVLGKVVELDVVGPEVVGCGYAADAGELMHILFCRVTKVSQSGTLCFRRLSEEEKKGVRGKGGER